MNVVKIAEFYGIQQQKDGTLLNNGTARKAINMETGDGNLSVSEAFQVLVSPPSSAPDETWRALFAFERATSDDIYIACSNKRVMYATVQYGDLVNEWHELASLQEDNFTPSELDDAFDAQLARIWNTDYILLATGGTQILKIPIDELLNGNPTCEQFGSGVYYLDTSLTITNVGTNSITVSGTALLDGDSVESLNTRARVYGVYIMDGNNVKYLLYVDDITASSPVGNTVISLDLTGCTVGTSDKVQLRGGTSDKKVAAMELFHDRLWCAGDPDNVSRLYWSCAAGEGRTIEDWVSDDFNEDASGGHVDVGVADGDHIVALKALSDCLLIFKANSVWRLYGDRPSNYTLERISDEVGAVDDKEIVTKYGTPYWLTRNGIYYSDGSNCMNVDGEVDYLRDLFWEVNGSMRRPACTVPWLRKFFFSVYSDTIGRFILTRDTVTGAYLTFNGADIADVATASDYILFLASNGAVLTRGENTEQLLTYPDNQPLEAVWESQIMEINSLVMKKQLKALYFRAKGGRIRIRIHTDIGDTQTELVPQEMQTNVIRLPIQMSEARHLQVIVSNVNGSRFSIEGGICLLFDRQYEG